MEGKAGNEAGGVGNQGPGKPVVPVESGTRGQESRWGSGIGGTLKNVQEARRWPRKPVDGPENDGDRRILNEEHGERGLPAA